MSGEGLFIADVGTGSGCIAIALATELPAVSIYALEVSPAALKVAEGNAVRLGVVDRIHFLESDLFSGLSTAGAGGVATLEGAGCLRQTRESRITNQGSVLFDLIVSNPPYVGRSEAAALAREVREHEPAIAHLKPGGILILELGHNSRAAVEPLLDSPDWTNVRVTNDLAGIARVLSSEKACEFASNALL